MIEHSCRYYPTIMVGPVIRFGFGYNDGERTEMFSGEKVTEWSAEISASRNGVSLDGRFPVYKTREQIDAIRGLLALACDAAAIIGERGDHDAAKQWVANYNSRRASTAAAA